MIIGNEFIEVFAEEARKLEGIEFLAQGPFGRTSSNRRKASRRTTMRADCRKI